MTRRRILLWGLMGDEPLMAVLQELLAHRMPHVFLDQRKLGSATLEFDDKAASGRLTIDGALYELRSFGAVYARPHDMRAILHQAASSVTHAERERLLAMHRQLFAWLDLSSALVINRPSAMTWTASKPLQSEHVRTHGFKVPATLVTTTPQDVRRFVAEHESVISKSISTAISTVSRLTAKELKRIDTVMNCPTQFQAYVSGVDWRVHVIGERVHACKIECAADDYRVAAQDGIAVSVRQESLPEPIADRCRALTRSLGLGVAGIDLRHATDGSWYCFEVNTSPAFTYFEHVSGQPLAADIGRLLMDACGAVGA